MDETTDTRMDNLLEAQADVEQQDGEASDPSEYEDKSKEELVDLLRQNQEEVDNQKQGQEHLRSLHDRQLNEIREQMAELRGVVSVKKDDSADDLASQQQFDTDWQEKINENPGEATMKFVRGVLTDALTQFRTEMKDAVGGVSSKVETLDPEYLAHKKQVDELISQHKLTRPQALAIAKKYAPAVTQPGRAAIPGKVSTGSRGKVANGAMSFDDTTTNVMRFLGLDSAEIGKELSKELGEL